jgi:hypothetical protein
LPENKNFRLNSAGHFSSKLENHFELNIVPVAFSNQAEAVQYLYQRRLFLLQKFQDHMEPYYGLVTANRSCIDKSQLSADMVSKDKGTDFFKLSMPIDDQLNIFDCANGDSWGQMNYYFFNCKATNMVYDIRISGKDKLMDFEKNIECD